MWRRDNQPRMAEPAVPSERNMYAMRLPRKPPRGLRDLALTNVSAEAAPDRPRDATSLRTELEEAKRLLEVGFRTYQPGALLTAFGLLNAACSLGFSERGFELAHLELATAFALHFPAGTGLPTGSSLRAMVDALRTYTDLYPEVTWKDGDDPKSRAARVRRLHTFRLRHTAYPYEAVAIFDRIAGEFRADTSSSLGTSAERALFFVQQSPNIVAKRIVQGGALEPFVEWLETSDGAVDAGWTALFDTYADELDGHGLPGFATGSVRSILDRLVLEPGSLTDEQFEHLHLDNPVRRRPFVKLEGRFYCFAPSSIADSQGDILEDLLAQSVKKVREKLGRARSLALEAMAQETLRRMFPNAEILEGAHWTDPRDGRGFETDIVVMLDGMIFIVEAKSNVVSSKSRRGSGKWFDDLDSIVLKACEQAGRLGGLLSDRNAKAITLTGEFGTRVIKPDAVKGVIKFGVSLERVTFGSHTPGSFLHDRIVAAGLDPMPILTIGDLWQIERLLDNEAQRFHYLLRRAQLDGEMTFVADEQDLIALYLVNGFNDENLKGHAVDVYGLSANLRFYQPETPHYDPRVPLPILVTPLWRYLISESETTRLPSWRMVAYDLLHFTADEQDRFRKDLVAAKRMVREGGRGAGVINQVQKFSIRHPVRIVCLTGAKAQSPQFQRQLDEVWASHQTDRPKERAILLVQDVSSGRPYPSIVRYQGTCWRDEGVSYDEDGSPRTPPRSGTGRQELGSDAEEI